MRPARVAAVETLSPRFRLVDIEGEALRDVTWAAGQKIQVSVGGGLSTRTYTPVMWDAGRGRTRLLAFAHGDGLGSRWVSSLRAGDRCQFFGPRRSLDLSALAAPIALFGDETSFGLATLLREDPPTAGAIQTFEVSDAAEARAVLASIGIDQATLIERRADDGHLVAAADEVLRCIGSGADVALTGRAPSIQRVGRALKAAGVRSTRIRTKAYWAPGKTGLD
ncbi:siderophore-interacting protein [Bradyrhizobium sp. U87765 SZCCT0131]|nr:MULTISPECIES: siderophore-interacting protein [unclassified Bradyrhizobium]MBR1222947.1 siderophore-interacting protein [Bradyrhizobium sp. U87765 SZCCT0131]MBR1262683.1 siderophore-interacting protein [Bradyrhizobium sp. U87765 SZCCT0134]MBR1308845.1 siderophore-interacting protein [Bradyrhizobium sp. U87765 SZCCT0110]MBR1318465.1 siderophore-interacting protein [Bradyrhizobium sp. U87765 SZCCT0109]MBR1352169.1 siderophore-interacting protein [Bradyrhizobium sp. U87765 SZCCT0048]